MKLAEWDNSTMYRVACECTDQEHDITLDLEYDSDVNMIFLNMYKNLRWCSYKGCDQNFFSEIWCRIKTALKMIFTGYIEVNCDFILREDQINGFMEALEEGKRKLEKLKDGEVPERTKGAGC